MAGLNTKFVNAHVQLEPLGPAHFEGLNTLVRDAHDQIFVHTHLGGSFETYFETALGMQSGGDGVLCVISPQNKYVGMTRLFWISRPDAHAEIGYTWYHPDYWGTAINPACKLLLMTHAFETHGIERVQLKTDALNAHSRAAMLKMGATYEGTLRRHKIRPDGTWRNSAFFSVIKNEWPKIKAGLVARLEIL